MSPGDERAPVRPAVRWFLRLQGADSPALSPEELRQWEQFVRDPAQFQELIEIKKLWRAARALGGPGMPTAAELVADDFDESLSVREWMARRNSRARARSSRFVRHARWLSLAASVVALAIGVALYAPSWLAPSTQEQMQVFSTQRAQQRSVELADGSVVTLGARTEIDTRITATERVIVLKRGEAWFKVAHEKRRAFKVLAGDGVITAVGTEFNVRRDLYGDLDRITVTVGAGIVNVESKSNITQAPASRGRQSTNAVEWKPARLVKGQELSYNRGGERGDVKLVDIEAAAAWKEGRLEYIHQPLRAVVASVNRYSDKPIVLADDSVAGIDFSGTVFEGQIDEWIRALEAAFPIHITESDDRILIQSQARD